MMPLIALLLAASAPAPGAPASTRGLYLQLIHQARADGRPRAAIAYLDDFDRRYPDDMDARILRVNSLLDLGDIDAAEAAAASLRDEAMQAHLLAARGRWAESVPLYRRAIAASPADPMLRNALGYAQLQAGLTAEAIETLRAAQDLAPSTPVIRNNLLLALALGRQNGEVEATLARIPNPRDRDLLRHQLTTEAARLTPRKAD